MQSGRHILLDLFLHAVVHGNLPAVYHFLDSLAVLILAGYLGGNLDVLKIVLLFDSHRDQSLCNLADFLRSRFRGNDLSVV